MLPEDTLAPLSLILITTVLSSAPGRLLTNDRQQINSEGPRKVCSQVVVIAIDWLTSARYNAVRIRAKTVPKIQNRDLPCRSGLLEKAGDKSLP